jgi:hypothetical protein
MPLVIAGFILVLEKYVLGGLLTMFATALEINANHFQMTYYLLIFLLILSVIFFICNIKDKTYKPLLNFSCCSRDCWNICYWCKCYKLCNCRIRSFSTRKSELSFNLMVQHFFKMTKDYITEYSYGLAESFNLIA